MKTALCITNCADKSPQALQDYWMSVEEPVRLTVVHPYDLEPHQFLTKETVRIARQQAESRLRQWTDRLPNSGLGDLRTETLLANFDLALQLHLIIRQYDHLLIVDQNTVLSPASLAVVNQTQTHVCFLADTAPTLRAIQPGCVDEGADCITLHQPSVFAVAC